MADILDSQTPVVVVVGDPLWYDQLLRDWADGKVARECSDDSHAHVSLSDAPAECEDFARWLRDGMHQREIEAAAQPPVLQVSYTTGPLPVSADWEDQIAEATSPHAVIQVTRRVAEQLREGVGTSQPPAARHVEEVEVG